MKTTKAFQIEPAGCSSVLTFEELFSLSGEDLEGVVAEEKFNGRRYLYQVRPRKATQCYLTSRRISKKNGLFVEKQDSLPFMRDHSWPEFFDGAIFDGEIIDPSMKGMHSDVGHLMSEGKGIFCCWDILRLGHIDFRGRPLEARKKVLFLHAHVYPSWFVPVRHSLKPKALLRAIIAKGGEGVICKRLDSAYGKGWVKVKDEQTYDCVITGYEMSTEGKYAKNGWIKNIKLGQFVPSSLWDSKKPWLAEREIRGVSHMLVDVGKASGMTEPIRAKITKNQSRLVGTSVEVDAQMRLPSGKFAHPRFVRLRPDKNAEDCTYAP